MDSQVVSEANAVPVDVKIPKNCKENRYYYRHREEVLARKKEQRMVDPEYRARQELKEQKKLEREEKKKMLDEKRKMKANALLMKPPGA